MWCKRFLLLSAVCLINLRIEASTIRNDFMNNLNSGLKILGKKDRQIFVSHHSYYNQLPSGISNKVADLVSQSFLPSKTNGKRNNIRQDAIVIGDEGPSMSENPFMSGMLKMLGFDSAKIGAFAVNGIIFIAQMVRYGASNFVDFMMEKTWDWYKIVDQISQKINNKTENPPIPSTERKVF